MNILMNMLDVPALLWEGSKYSGTLRLCESLI